MQFEKDESNATMTNLGGVTEDAGPECMPRGVYDVIIDEVTYGISQRSGNPMWTWKFEVEEGDYANRKLFFHTPFIENSLPRLKKILGRIAPELIETPFDPEALANEAYFSGKRCRVRVDISKYEGQNRNSVKDVLPPSEEGASGFM
ncbi:MAG TPA: DUF669 domain-containing protein [Treponemataceae bacterium]|nr:DUF669 domain-containing protein [Treponemataceae bacterium]